MGWNRWYTTKSYLSSALWIVPLIAVALENVTIRFVFWLQGWLDWVPWLGATPAGISDALSTIETMTISFIVFTFGAILISIQVASGQLTPRIIATALLRNNVIRFTVGLFTFTMLFAVGTGIRIEPGTYHPAVTIVWVLGIASIATFLFLIDYTARLLRPISIVWRIGEQGINVIRSVYPDSVDIPRQPRPRQATKAPCRSVGHEGTSAIVLAVNQAALISLAHKVDGLIEFMPRVGNFVSTGEPLFRLYGNATRLGSHRLRAQVAFGPERTIEQDSTFAFRVIVDIAIKALSPAINDPTTAVLAIDQLHRLLRLVGRCHLHDDGRYDADGVLRLIFPNPIWQDFVELAISEIRLYGAGNFQVSRRLRAMIESLLESLPKNRRPALRRELDLLDRTLEKLHCFPEDLTLSRQADLQGLGGASTPVDQPAIVQP
ncbi:MAG TPA: DUF2254 domain-containing protein [Rhodopila sp.]|nr:DUF2254 domain-containing protein [Rhodopila sp.]